MGVEEAVESILLVALLLLQGCGDFTLSEVSALPDPCPLPDKIKRRSLSEKERLIYAPMAGVGGVVYDKVHFFGVVVCCVYAWGVCVYAHTHTHTSTNTCTHVVCACMCVCCVCVCCVCMLCVYVVCVCVRV